MSVFDYLAGIVKHNDYTEYGVIRSLHSSAVLIQIAFCRSSGLRVAINCRITTLK